MAQIDSLLLEVLEKRGSDLHFIAGDPPRIRLFGDLTALKPDKLAPEFVKQALYEILPKTALERFEVKDGADFAYTLTDRGRFRVYADLIVVGESRDRETMSIAVTAAEMGILVMGTLHTNGAAPTVDRMVNVFPSDKQSHVRTMLSTSLRGVVSQQLLQRADKQGRVAALEILVNTPAASNLIRQGKLDQLENTMQAGGQFGMRTMDTAIQLLLDHREITGKEAYKKAINKAKFEDLKDSG